MAGETVYRAYLFDRLGEFHIMQATVTGIEVDGVEMVRQGDLLLPMNGGWRKTELDARRDARDEMIRRIGVAQKKVDQLADEIMHESLSNAEAQ